MKGPLFTTQEPKFKRIHFINSYPPFNVTKGAGPDCLSVQRDLLLYIHIPFCPTICSYCFYRRFGNASPERVQTYLKNLKREITIFAARTEVEAKRVKSLYIGGGTPTVLTGDQFVDLIGFLRQQLDLSNIGEICCEMMPHEGTVTQEKLAVLKELGVTRLSFGVESLTKDVLELHNRHCTRELYEKTYAMVCEARFEKVNVDMMSGLVGETWESWVDVVGQLLDWSPPSISIYKTEMFYNTPIFRKARRREATWKMISDEEEIRHIRYAHDTLCEKGGYVVANCLHLLKDRIYDDLHYRSLWEGDEMKGLGLSAHSIYEGVLHQNTSELSEYYQMIEERELPVKRAYRMTARDRISQAMVYGLKNLAVNRLHFEERFGVDLMVLYQELIDRLKAAGAVTLDEQWLRVTPEYYIFADDICRQFFLPEYESMMPAHLDRTSSAHLPLRTETHEP